MKYIIYKDEANGGEEQAILFPDSIGHSVMARNLGGMLRMSNQMLGKNTSHHITPVAAGFFNLINHPVNSAIGTEIMQTVCCYGNSESMKLQSRGPADDKAILNACL